MNKLITASIFALTLLSPSLTIATTGEVHQPMDLTDSAIGFTAIALFTFAYLLVMAEEFIHLRKSKPVILAAGLIWAMIGWFYTQHDMSELAESAVRHNLL